MNNMRHLEEVEMNFFEHWFFTIKTMLKLIAATVILFIHGWLPFLFEHTTSKLVGRIYNSFHRAGKQILIRFNTKWEDDPQKRQWRILVEGKETLASHISIKVPCYTIEEPVDGIKKFHFLCVGQVNWIPNSNCAYIED